MGSREVTFQDLLDGTSKKRTGYGKIQFCGEQARRDGLQYFWVDTCCIDKSNAVELQEAITSMFRWYQQAIKCYAYLLDVSRPRDNSAGRSNKAWKLAFRGSEWFTQGWTLQELIAPASVDFFSKEGELLGNKVSLERDICETTRIPASALRGRPLSDFSVPERMSWAANRVTTKDEDKVYSLFGIFGIFLPIMYGEGQDNAFQRLQEAVDKKVNGYEFHNLFKPSAELKIKSGVRLANRDGRPRTKFVRFASKKRRDVFPITLTMSQSQNHNRSSVPSVLLKRENLNSRD